METWENALKQYEEGIQNNQNDQALAARDALLYELPRLTMHASAMKVWATANKFDDAGLRYTAYHRSARLTDLSDWDVNHPTALAFEDLLALYKYHNDPTIQEADKKQVQPASEQAGPSTSRLPQDSRARPRRHRQDVHDDQDDASDAFGPSYPPAQSYPPHAGQHNAHPREAQYQSPAWNDRPLQPGYPNAQPRQTRPPSPSPAWSESLLNPNRQNSQAGQARAPSPGWDASYARPSSRAGPSASSSTSRPGAYGHGYTPGYGNSQPFDARGDYRGGMPLPGAFLTPPQQHHPYNPPYNPPRNTHGGQSFFNGPTF